MTTYTGSIKVSGSLNIDGGLGTGSFSGTLSDSLTATIDSSGNGSATDSVSGNIVLNYTAPIVGSQSVTIPVDYSNLAFNFQSGSYSLTENVPISQLGTTVPVTFSGEVNGSQAEITGNASGIISGSLYGLPFTGTVSGTGLLQADTAISPIVTNDFEAILQRAPTSSEGATYTGELANSSLSASGLIETLIATPEAQSEVFPVVQLYQAIYGRVPAAAGLQYWTHTYEALLSGTSATDAMVALATPFVNPAITPEFVARYGTDPTPSTFVTELYTNVLGREPATAGLTYWTNVLTGLLKTQTSIQADAALVAQFVVSNEYKASTDPYVHGFLASAASGTETFSGSLFSQTPDTSAPAAVIGQAVTVVHTL